MSVIVETGRRVLEGYLAPRASVRRLIDGDHGLDVALLMLVLGYIVSFMLTSLIPGAMPEGGPRVAQHVTGLIAQVIVFFVLSTLIFWFGRMSGGVGTRRQTFIAVAWHELVTSPLAPLPAGVMADLFKASADAEGAAQAAPAEIGGSAVLLALVATGAWFWLLAQYIAELHGFRNVWGVLGVLLGVPFALVMILMAAMSGAPVPQ